MGIYTLIAIASVALNFPHLVPEDELEVVIDSNSKMFPYPINPSLISRIICVAITSKMA